MMGVGSGGIPGLILFFLFFFILLGLISISLLSWDFFEGEDIGFQLISFSLRAWEGVEDEDIKSGRG